MRQLQAHVTHHTSHITHHTSHITHHTSHIITHHIISPILSLIRPLCRRRWHIKSANRAVAAKQPQRGAAAAETADTVVKMDEEVARALERQVQQDGFGAEAVPDVLLEHDAAIGTVAALVKYVAVGGKAVQVEVLRGDETGVRLCLIRKVMKQCFSCICEGNATCGCSRHVSTALTQSCFSAGDMGTPVSLVPVS